MMENKGSASRNSRPWRSLSEFYTTGRISAHCIRSSNAAKVLHDNVEGVVSELSQVDPLLG